MFIDPVAAWISALVPAVILAGAACQKLTDLRALRALVKQYAILPRTWVTPVAFSLPYFELATAIAMVLPGTRRQASLTALGLLVIFTLAIAINLRRGQTDLDCGCHFGGARIPLSGALIVRNGLLTLWLVPVAGAAVGNRSLGWLDVLTIAVASLVGAMAYIMSAPLLLVRRQTAMAH